MIADPKTRLLRPRQLYTGAAKRDVVPIGKRTTHQPLVG
jgi:citrate synthase